tara:strand:+ start:76 stop:1572 length:1497 start_codon:yes stop_codon:yes gene_type:complete
MGNTYQVRTITANGGDLPVSGGIIREEHLNDEFTSLIAAFNASTGHLHNGTDSPEVETLGANKELKTTSTSIFPNTTTIDIGTTGAKFRDVFISRDIKIDSSGSIQTSTIADTGGNESIKIVATGSAVNEITVTNAATNNDVSISTTGTDTNISLALTPKGSGLIKLAKDDLAIGGTAVTTTAAELNLLDGDVASIGTTAVAGGDGIITKDADATTTRLTTLDTFDTYLSQTNKTLENKTLTSPVINTSVSGDAIDTDLTSVSGSDNTLASAKAIKTYVDAQILTKDNTDEITEGSSNLYFTNARADARITAVLQDDDTFGSPSATNIASSESIKAYVQAQVATKDNTDEMTEGSTNLYFTNARADARITNALTGAITVTGELTANGGINEDHNNGALSNSNQTLTLDCHNGNNFSVTTAANITSFVVSNLPASGTAFFFTLKVAYGGSHSIAWGSSVKWHAGTPPVLSTNNMTDVFTFYTVDSGTTIYGFTAGQAVA